MSILNSRRVVDAVIHAAIEEIPLPRTLDKLPPTELPRVEAFARRLNVTPEAALSLAREAQRAAIAEARAADRIAQAARGAR